MTPESRERPEFIDPRFAPIPWKRIAYEQGILMAESDRGCLVVGAMVVETALTAILERVFDGLKRSEVRRLFSSFASKCNEGLAQGWDAAVATLTKAERVMLLVQAAGAREAQQRRV